MPDFQSLVKSTIKQHHSKNIVEAERKCNNADGYLKKALSEKNKEQINLAIDMYMEALKLNSKCVRAYVGLAYISFAGGDIKTAKKIINTARDYDPFNPNFKNLSEKIESEEKNTKFSLNTENSLSSLISKNIAKKENKAPSIFDMMARILNLKPQKKVTKNPKKEDFGAYIAEVSKQMKKK